MAIDDKSKEDDIQQEIHVRRKFSVAGVIGQQAGGAIKGASPVPKLTQVTTEIIQFIDQHVSDSSGALKSVLRRRIKANEVTIDLNINKPMLALREIIHPIMEKDSVLHEFVRQVDVRWGQIFKERPHFQQAGQSPHTDDEYTHESVRNELIKLLEKIEAVINGGKYP